VYPPVALCVPYPVPLRWSRTLCRVYFFLSVPSSPAVYVVAYADIIGIQVTYDRSGITQTAVQPFAFVGCKVLSLCPAKPSDACTPPCAFCTPIGNASIVCQ